MSVALRTLAAIPFNYLVTSLALACLARVLPIAPAEASIAATLMSFALFAMIVVIAFSVHSVARLWFVMIVAALALGGGLWWSIAAGGRI